MGRGREVFWRKGRLIFLTPRCCHCIAVRASPRHAGDDAADEERSGGVTDQRHARPLCGRKSQPELHRMAGHDAGIDAGIDAVAIEIANHFDASCRCRKRDHPPDRSKQHGRRRERYRTSESARGQSHEAAVFEERRRRFDRSKQRLHGGRRSGLHRPRVRQVERFAPRFSKQRSRFFRRGQRPPWRWLLLHPRVARRAGRGAFGLAALAALAGGDRLAASCAACAADPTQKVATTHHACSVTKALPCKSLDSSIWAGLGFDAAQCIGTR